MCRGMAEAQHNNMQSLMHGLDASHRASLDMVASRSEQMLSVQTDIMNNRFGGDNGSNDASMQGEDIATALENVNKKIKLPPLVMAKIKESLAKVKENSMKIIGSREKQEKLDEEIRELVQLRTPSGTKPFRLSFECEESYDIAPASMATDMPMFEFPNNKSFKE
eukprot:9670106-Karenia_brevis.AAC.1